MPIRFSVVVPLQDKYSKTNFTKPEPGKYGQEKVVFRRPSQLRWGASNSLIVGEEEEGEEEKLAF